MTIFVELKRAGPKQSLPRRLSWSLGKDPAWKESESSLLVHLPLTRQSLAWGDCILPRWRLWIKTTETRKQQSWCQGIFLLLPFLATFYIVFVSLTLPAKKKEWLAVFKYPFGSAFFQMHISFWRWLDFRRLGFWVENSSLTLSWDV